MTKKTYKTKQAEQRGVRPASKPAAAPRERKKIVLPTLLLFMVAVWAWGSFYYGCLFHVSREFSFWATDTRLMQFVLCQNFGRCDMWDDCFCSFTSTPGWAACACR